MEEALRCAFRKRMLLDAQSYQSKVAFHTRELDTALCAVGQMSTHFSGLFAIESLQRIERQCFFRNVRVAGHG